ncbi:RibD family protein [Tenggerimyces flavus]|uniref:RibD family protein n=1 Tax=Tenggerimyces flavus TaxID=1708749 RepID=A0ABV7YM91_9ACTN|nr:dihydrofolate reductase family protein [Tenggerimyces flavus]MBM7789451.1 riboflavin biosynthesis pyrimidine reductase [Tenggerimyces flavus]
MANDDRARVVMAVGMSVDGRIAHRRDQLWFDEDAKRDWEAVKPASTPSLEAARSELIDRLYQPQAILEGSGSLARSTAGPVAGLPPEEPPEVLYSDFLPDEVVHRQGHERWFTTVDSRGRVEWEDEDHGEWDVLVLVSRATPAAYLQFLRMRRLCYLVAGDERVDLAEALRKMKASLGVTCVKSTAGGGLNGALLRAGLIDEIHLMVSPYAIGGAGTPTIFDGVPLAKGELPTNLRLLSTHAESDGMLWLRYEVA